MDKKLLPPKFQFDSSLLHNNDTVWDGISTFGIQRFVMVKHQCSQSLVLPVNFLLNVKVNGRKSLSPYVTQPAYKFLWSLNL